MEKLIKLEKLLKKTNCFDKVFRCGSYVGNGAFMVDDSLTDIGRYILFDEAVKCIHPEWSYKEIDDATIKRTMESRDNISIERANEWYATEMCRHHFGKTWLRIFKPVDDIEHNEEELLINDEYVKAFGLDYLYANNPQSMTRNESGQIIVMPCGF